MPGVAQVRHGRFVRLVWAARGSYRWAMGTGSDPRTTLRIAAGTVIAFAVILPIGSLALVLEGLVAALRHPRHRVGRRDPGPRGRLFHVKPP